MDDVNPNGRDDTPSGVLIWVALVALFVIGSVGWAVLTELTGP